VWKSVDRCQLDRPRRQWEDNIKLDRKERGCEDGKWMKLAQDCVCGLAFILLMLPGSKECDPASCLCMDSVSGVGTSTQSKCEVI
jgi:hypothetical protein